MSSVETFEIIMADEYDDADDLEWVPPTEAEQKVLNARRERSDKISKLMGDYMLKGYKMLATVCSKCGTIELEDRQSQKYCVACEEIDCEENSKDNPAVNQRAAQHQIAEGIERRSVQEPVVQQQRVQDRRADPTFSSGVRNVRPLSSGNRPMLAPATSEISQPLPLIHSSLDTVFAKMASATEALAEAEDVETSRQLVNLIKDCADCIQSLKSASLVM